MLYFFKEMRTPSTTARHDNKSQSKVIVANNLFVFSRIFDVLHRSTNST